MGEFLADNLPMVSPLILTNIIYTIIDFFISTSNSDPVDSQYHHQGAGFGVSAAMSWIYFAAICVVLGIVYLIFNRLVFYHE